jgi:hypothetical protein
MWRGPFAYGHAGATRIRWGRVIESGVDGRFRNGHLTSGVLFSRPSSPEDSGTEQREQRGDGEDPRGPLVPAHDPGRSRSRVRRLRIGRLSDGSRDGDASRDRGTRDGPCTARERPLTRRTPVLRRGGRASTRRGGKRRRRGAGSWLGAAARRTSRVRGPNARRSTAPQRRRTGADGLGDGRGSEGWSTRGGRTLIGLRPRLCACHGSLGRRRCRRDHGGRRRNRLRRWRGGSRRQQRQRIDVALGIIRVPDPEVDVRNVHLHVTRRPNRPDRLGLGDAVAGTHGDRAEMEQRDGIAVQCPDRHRAAVPGQPAGERHLSGGGCADGGAGGAAHVDSAVTVLVVFGAAEVETAQHRPVRGPAPSSGRPRHNQRNHSQHRGCRFLSRQHRRPKLAGKSAVVKIGYRVCR